MITSSLAICNVSILCAAVAFARPGELKSQKLAPANMSLPLDPHRHTYLNTPLLCSKPSNRNHQSNYCEYNQHFHDHLLQAC